MRVLYDIGIRLYLAGIYLASPFHGKASDWIIGRRGWYERLHDVFKPGEKVAWFHCSSLGEFEQGRPVMEAFREAHPEYRILLTFYSPSGYHVRKNYYGVDCVEYLPPDTPRNARRFLKLVNPQIAFFIKYEYWYHFLRESRRMGVKLILISAIFRKKQIFFRSYGKWFLRILKCFHIIFVQNKHSKDLLKEYGIHRVRLAGDTRFDRVEEVKLKARKLEEIDRFRQDKVLLIGGSTWLPDEKMILRLLRDDDRLKCIMVPHEPSRAHIEQLIGHMGDIPMGLWSNRDHTNLDEVRVLVVDAVGFLSSLYAYGDMAWIGGGFGKGIHNTLEAAVFGIPVIFGPNYKKFEEARELIRTGGGFSVKNYEECRERIRDFLDHPERRKNAGVESGAYVMSHTGATEFILEEIRKKV